MAKRVLLCDDEIHIIRAAEYKLVRAGYDVRVANDGEEGWAAIESCLPDMVITDCQMPRLDGIGLVQRIRGDARTAHLPVLMLTAKGFELSAAELASKWNVMAVVAKPFSPRDLLQRVNSVLNPAVEAATGV